MLDLEVKMNTEIQKHVSLNSTGLSSTTDAFSKIFESASKSFEMTKQIFKPNNNKTTYQNTKEEILFGKISFATANKTSGTNTENQAISQNYDTAKEETCNSKDDNSYIEDNQNENQDNKNDEESSSEETKELPGEIIVNNELTEIIINNECSQGETPDNELSSEEEISANEMKTNGKEISPDEKVAINKNELSKINNNLINNAKELRETGEKLLKIKEQAKEMSAYIEKEISSPEKVTTQNPIKPQNLISEYTKKTNDIFIKPEILSSIKTPVANDSTGDTQSTLSDVIAELDVDMEVSSLNESDQMQNNNQQTSFNFNTTTFGDLNGHITKLSLNKSADFTKVMKQKMTQEHEIINQVKEATSNTLTGGTKSVSIILRPEHLGRVNVNLSSTNGILTAQFTAQNQQAADALNKNIELLKQNLIDQGVKINEISVKVHETSHSENFTDNQNFSEDKSADFREQASHKNSLLSKKSASNSFEENNSYETEKDLNNNNEEIRHTNKKRNNDLGIYNNMGRKV